MSTMSSHVRPPPKNASFLQRFKERFTRSATPSSLNLRSNEYKRSPQARESSPASPTVRHMKSTPTLRGNLMPTPGPSSPREATETTQQRRAAALRACGLLEQSRIYGNGQYSDEEALIKFDGEDGDKKLIYDEDGAQVLFVPTGKKHSALSPSDVISTPAPPYSALPAYSPPPSSSPFATLQEKKQNQAIQMRSIGSVACQVENIEDEESRRLTEAAFLC